MTKESVWKQLVRKNPSFAVGPVGLTPKGLRKFFDVVWDASAAQAARELRPHTPAMPAMPELPDFLQGLMNGKLS